MKRITRDDKLEIQRLNEIEGLSYRDIGKKYNISHTRVGEIVNERVAGFGDNIARKLMKSDATKIEMLSISFDLQHEQEGVLRKCRNMLDKTEKIFNSIETELQGSNDVSEKIRLLSQVKKVADMYDVMNKIIRNAMLNMEKYGTQWLAMIKSNADFTPEDYKAQIVTEFSAQLCNECRYKLLNKYVDGLDIGSEQYKILKEKSKVIDIEENE